MTPSLRSFIQFQSMVGVASAMIFPFYILLLRNVGDSYAQFGWAYGLFALASALAYPFIGRLTDRFGDRSILLFYSWGMAVVLLTLPFITEIWHIYLVQIVMGFLGAAGRNTEKTVLARLTTSRDAGQTIGRYHTWTGVATAAAIVGTGYLVDFLTIGALFFLASFLFAISAVMLHRVKLDTAKPLS